MRPLLIALLLVGPAFTTASQAGGRQAEPARSSPRKVSLDYQRTRLRDVLVDLFAGTGLQYNLDPNARNVPITLKVRNVSIDTALRLVLRAGVESEPKLSMVREGATYNIGLGLDPRPPRERAPDPSPDPRLSKRVTFNWRGVGFRKALERLMEDRKTPYVVETDVPEVPVTLRVADQSAEQALRELIRTASQQAPGLYLEREGEAYVIGLRRVTPPQTPTPTKEVAGDGREPRITLKLENTPLREAIETVLRGSGVQYAIDPSVPNVPINLNIRDTGLQAALRLVIRQGATAVPGLTLSREGEVYRVRVRNDSTAEAGPPAEPREQKKVTVNFRDTPLRDAINIIFTGTGEQFSVDPNVPNVPVNLNLRDVRLEAALRMIIRQAAVAIPGLGLTRDKDLWVVHVGPVSTPDVGPAGPITAELPAAWDRIPLRFQDVTVMTMMLGGVVVPTAADVPAAAAPVAAPAPKPVSRAKPGSKSKPATVPPRHALPATAPPATVAAPAAAGPGMGGGVGMGGYGPAIAVPDGIYAILGIRADNALLVRGTPDAIDELKEIIRSIDVPQREIQVRISAGRLAAEGRALNNAALQLSDVSGSDSMAAVITPRLNGDGTIELTIGGTLRMAGVSRPIQSQVRVSAGKAAPIFTLGEGSRAVRVWVRASALP
jgi:hypothetical protein